MVWGRGNTNNLTGRLEALNRVAAQPDQSQRLPEKGSRSWKRRAAGLGAIALASLSFSAGIAYESASERTGASGVSEPLSGPTQTEDNIDTSTVVISFNTYKKINGLPEEIQAMDDKYNPDAVLLQEVRYSDLWRLQAMSGWYTTHVVAEGIKHGGLANVILTKQEPQNVKTVSFAGRSLRRAVMGAVTGSVTPTPRSFDNAWQENRGMVSLEIMALDWNEEEGKYDTKPVRIFTTHIAGAGKDDPNQEAIHLSQSLGFGDALAEQAGEDMSVIVGGDFNMSFEAMLDRVGAVIGGQVYRPGRTTMVGKTDEVNDWFVARGAGVLGAGRAEVIKKPLSSERHLSDHYAIMITFDGEQTRKYELTKRKFTMRGSATHGRTRLSVVQPSPAGIP